MGILFWLSVIAHPLRDIAFSCKVDYMLEVKAHMDIGMYM